MAFQAPTAAATRRRLSRDQPQAHTPVPPSSHLPTTLAPPSLKTSSADEEWIVFSPSVDGETTTYVTNSNTLSRVSELGSVVSTSSPRHVRQDTYPGAFDSDLETETEESEEADTDTDSLQAFRDMHAVDGGPPMLPTHDGLGTFPSSLRSLEDGLRLVGEENASTNARIQKWRMEQSQAFIDEIERATRRRKLSLASGVREEVDADAVSTRASMMTTDTSADMQKEEENAEKEGENESLWRRLTRSFIRDIIGLDDSVLEVLFGESLPPEAFEDLSVSSTDAIPRHDRLLNRIARELSVLVTAYTPTSASRAEGAFPAIARPSGEETPAGTRTPVPPRPLKRHRSDSVHFVPTLEAEHAALWGIEEEVAEAKRKDYWEQELDMRLVFSYLKSRFLPHAPPPPAPSVSIRHQHPLINSRRPSIAGSSGPAALRRASPSISIGLAGMRTGAGARSKSLDSLSLSTKSRGFYWDMASSVGSGKTGSCVGTGVWAAI